MQNRHGTENGGDGHQTAAQEECTIFIVCRRWKRMDVFYSALVRSHLDAVIQVRSHQCRVEEQGHAFFWFSPGYSWLSGLQGHIGGSHPSCHPPVLPSPICQGCVLSLIPQPVLTLGIIMSLVQDFAFGFIEPHEVLLSQVLKSV